MILLLEYLKHPFYMKAQRINWSLFFKLFISYFILIVPASLLSKLLINLINLREPEFNLGWVKIIFAGLILAPIIEEFIFRLVLIPKIRNFVFLCCFTLIMMLFFLIRNHPIYFFVFLLASMFIIYIIKDKRLLKRLQVFIIKNFRYIFYFSCISFGFYHITNFSLIDYKVILLSPFIVLPQVLGGFFLGFIRTRFGIIYSIIFHSMINVLPVLFLVEDLCIK
jgi:membrane protease YdiL (CAAX protease family)